MEHVDLGKDDQRAQGEATAHLRKSVRGNHDAANLLSRLQDELEENSEVVPEYINLKPGSVSLSRYMEYTLKVVLELNLRSHDAVTREMKEAAGADKILDYGEFKRACEAIRPVRAITESSYAFIFWRALTMEKGATVSEVLSAAADPGAALEAAGGQTAGVSVTSAWSPSCGTAACSTPSAAAASI